MKRKINIKHTLPPLFVFKMLKNILQGRGYACGVRCAYAIRRLQYRGSVAHWLNEKNYFNRAQCSWCVCVCELKQKNIKQSARYC
jgi:hypothetical protein